MSKPIQDLAAVRTCFGCGADNPQGLHLKSIMVGEEAHAEFQPQPFHTGGFPGHVYGGLISSLLDCHSCNFAIARFYGIENRAIGSDPLIHCVTAQLNISLVQPVPISSPIELRARQKSVEGRKMWVQTQARSNGVVCAEAEILAVRLTPERVQELLHSNVKSGMKKLN